MMNEPNHFRRSKFRFLFFLFVPLLVLGISAVVMFLWNAVLPPLIAVGRIGFWQATGLFVLCRILFGGFGFRGKGGNGFRGNGWGGPGGWRGKWQNMTEEEKVKFREEWRQRCEQRKQQRNP